ncbi:uncharacterized protein LOC119687520 [Teleopsis dalmanni]|uniref:uncharacterized protein LOC119687520 n=1 Tax=Teleopsis dalmanni TaxID=139649 RepID=UPI0018CFC5F8|nr:uncharacterized protein LOC119687520 [Teleopsis dalmanni]
MATISGADAIRCRNFMKEIFQNARSIIELYGPSNAINALPIQSGLFEEAICNLRNFKEFITELRQKLFDKQDFAKMIDLDIIIGIIENCEVKALAYLERKEVTTASRFALKLTKTLSMISGVLINFYEN